MIQVLTYVEDVTARFFSDIKRSFMRLAMQTITRIHASTHVEHVAAKVATDLKRVQRIYGLNSPSDVEIFKHQKDLIKLLEEGYLSAITYGFKYRDKWLVAWKYQFIDGIYLDDDPGGVIGFKEEIKDVSDGYFTFFLKYSKKWHELSERKQKELNELFSFHRTKGDEPEIDGRWIEGRSYSSGPFGVTRSMISKASR